MSENAEEWEKKTKITIIYLYYWSDLMHYFVCVLMVSVSTYTQNFSVSVMGAHKSSLASLQNNDYNFLLYSNLFNLFLIVGHLIFSHYFFFTTK